MIGRDIPALEVRRAHIAGLRSIIGAECDQWRAAWDRLPERARRVLLAVGNCSTLSAGRAWADLGGETRAAIKAGARRVRDLLEGLPE